MTVTFPIGIVHTLQKAFDTYSTLDARGAFLDMPKVLAKFGMKG